MSSPRLHLAPRFTLPREAALQRFAILAMTGAGKTNTAVVLAEEMYDAGIPWVAVDPKGDWWGVRADEGKHKGLAVPVFGGLHGDVPLEPTGGKVMANLIADKRLTCVLDVSEFESKAEQLRFLTDFAQTLLRANRQPLMVFCEEADEYLPQKVMRSETRVVGAFSRLIKRGRFRGVYVTLISQRTASLNKDALSQVDTLIPMRTSWPPDQKRIAEWASEHAVGKDLLDSIATLDDGEVWLWSPQKLKLVKRVTLRRRHTFDSGQAPDLSEDQPVAKLADIDLGEVEGQLADTIERAKAEDPAELRKQNQRLKREIARLEAQPEPEQPEPERIEVPVLTEKDHKLLGTAQRTMDRMYEELGDTRTTLDELAMRVRQHVEEAPAPPPSRADPPRRPTQPPPRPADRGGHPRGEDDGKPLARAERRILAVLSQYPQGRSVQQIAVLTGYSVKSGGFKNSLSSLRTKGFISPRGEEPIAVTEGGVAAVGDVEPLPTGTALQRYWLNKLGADNAYGKCLATLCLAYPSALSPDEIAEQAGYSPTSGGFKNALSRLRSLELVSGRGELVASPELFD